MSEQPLNFRRSVTILRHRIAAVGIVAAVGFVAGAGYTELNLPMHQANALVVLPASNANTATQAVIATSGPVLQGALPSIHPAVSGPALRSRVQVTPVGGDVLEIMAQSSSDAQAESMANAVADSYVAYVGAANPPVGQVTAQVLAPATSATATRLPVRMGATAILGALAGALIGIIGALAIGRRSGQLRERDEIADAIGIPVLASVPVARPADAARWARLLEDYEPSVTEGFRLRHALADLDLADGRADGSSLTVLSLASDRRALALGPQLARFAASDGIQTTLVIGPQQDPSTVKALHAAALASARPSDRLRVTVAGQDGGDQQPGTTLSVVVTVVDGQTPRITNPMRTTATVLGVSAGAATAEQLARVAASAAANGHRITGILVADPDPADPTTGRLPQLARTSQNMPTRLTGTLR